MTAYAKPMSSLMRTSSEPSLRQKDESCEESVTSTMNDAKIESDSIDSIPSIPCSYCGEPVPNIPRAQEAHAVKHHTHFKCLHCNATMDTEAKLVAACEIAHPHTPCQPSEEEMFEMRLLDIVASLYFSPAYYEYLKKYEPESLSPRDNTVSSSGPGP